MIDKSIMVILKGNSYYSNMLFIWYYKLSKIKYLQNKKRPAIIAGEDKKKENKDKDGCIKKQTKLLG